MVAGLLNLATDIPVNRQLQRSRWTPYHTYGFSSVLNSGLFSAPPLDLLVLLASLPLSPSHSRSAAIEIANQLFDLRKLISSEFVMSYSPRRAEEADAAEGRTDRARGVRSGGPRK